MIQAGLRQEPEEHLAIHTLLDEAVEWAFKMHPNAEDRITIQRHYAADLPTIQAGKRSLLTTFINIINNATASISDKGTISLTTTRKEQDEKSFVEVYITDTGSGIPRRDLAKVFQLSFTTKEHGMGFGLWRDRAVVRWLGGEIEVDSEEGKGSTFCVRIPATTDRVM